MQNKKKVSFHYFPQDKKIANLINKAQLLESVNI